MIVEQFGLKIYNFKCRLQPFALPILGTLGSVVPVGGTAAGVIVGVGSALVAYALASQTDDYLGDYLRYIG